VTNIEEVILTTEKGETIDITDLIREMVACAEVHYDALRESIDEHGGDYEKGYSEWEADFTRAEGEEAMANVVLSLANRLGIEHPSEDDQLSTTREDAK
jgi:hypothetical protein